jgi:hypothetical protein
MMLQGPRNEMGDRARRRVRLLPARGEAVSDAEPGADGYGDYLDEVVFDYQA